METKYKHIANEAELERAAGTGADDDGFKILVQYEINGKNDPTAYDK